MRHPVVLPGSGFQVYTYFLEYAIGIQPVGAFQGFSYDQQVAVIAGRSYCHKPLLSL
jgi:hypothetical protein